LNALSRRAPMAIDGHYPGHRSLSLHHPIKPMIEPCAHSFRTRTCPAPLSSHARAAALVSPDRHHCRPSPPVLPCRFANSVDLQDERASPGASPSRAAPPLPLPVARDPLEPHRHRGPPPAAAILHHQPSSRPSLSKVKISKCSPSSSLHFPLFTRAPRALGHRRRRKRRPPPEPLPDLLRRCFSLRSEPLVSFLIFSSSSWSLFLAIWSTGTFSRPSPASSRRRCRRPHRGQAIRRRPPLACSRGRPIGADGPDLKGGIPLRSVHRGPVDQVHMRRSTALHQHGVSIASARPITACHVAHPQPFHWLPWQFCKRTSSFWNSQPCPSTYRNPFS
jgi:hypothetical protein